MIHYRVSYENPLTFYLQIELTLDVAADAQAPLELQLPAWRPGRYELQNFAQKIQKVEVFDAITNQPLPYRKLTKDRWEVPNAAGRTVRVRYNFYAHQMDAGGSWLDESQLYLNPVQALMYAEGRQLEDLTLKGFNHPIPAVEILRWREEGEAAEAETAEAPRRRKQPL